MKLDIGVDVSYMKSWCSKEKAMMLLVGGPADSYKNSGYLYILDITYSGSHIRMHFKSPGNEFMYMFVSLYAFIKDFNDCRPIVVVDSNHLKFVYAGTFVSANTLVGA
ncbi:hypothetical protein HAX54_012579, partial [Datura stramonium]|nr:hypothetical protein [Datura stramonium]